MADNKKKRTYFTVKGWVKLREEHYDTIADAARGLNSNEKILKKIEQGVPITRAKALKHLKSFRDKHDPKLDIYSRLVDVRDKDNQA